MIPVSNEFAEAAWSQLWQVTALVVFVGVVTRLFCRHRPHLAYLLWMLVVFKCLTPPVWSSPVGVFSWLQVSLDTASVADRPAVVEMNSTDLEMPVDLLSEDEAAEPIPDPPVRAQRPLWTASLLGTIWLCGAVLLAGFVLIKWAWLHLLPKAGGKNGEHLQSTATVIARRLGMRRTPRIELTSRSVGPAVFGFFRPIILLPEALLTALSAEGLQSVLAHEMVHLRRRDTLFGTLQAAVQTLWWFHPLVWWANRQMCRERERCCDEEVVAGLSVPPRVYARSLLDVVELRRKLRPVFAFPGLRPVEITSRRLEDIMKRSAHFHRRSPRWCWAVVLIAAAALLPGAGLVLDTDATHTVQAAAEENEAAKESQPSKTPNAPAVTYNSGLIQRLPEDGTWAKYRWESKRGGQNAGNGGFTTISSVGRLTVDGKDCRWIELKNEPQNGDARSRWLAKVLVPEQELSRGAGIVGHIVQGWIKHGDQAPVNIDEAQGGGLNATLGGAMDDVKKLERKVVESKLGKLDCEGVAGTITQQPDPNNPNIRPLRTSTFETRLHDKAPFGVVTRRWQLKFMRNNQATASMTSTNVLVDFGTGAKSELPDKGYDPKEDRQNQQHKNAAVNQASRSESAGAADDSASRAPTERRAQPAAGAERPSAPGDTTITLAAPNDTHEAEAVAALKALGAIIERDENGKVVELNLPNNPRVTDADLEHLKALTNLKSLMLAGCPQITDAGLQHVKGLNTLEVLFLGHGTLNSRNVTDAGLVHIKDLTHLRTLVLSNTETTDAGFTHLKGLSNLEGLWLMNTKVGDAGLAHLEGFKRLTELGLEGTQVTDDGLKHLEGLTNLKRLWIGNTKITDAGLEHLTDLANLNWLWLIDTKITDAGLERIKGMTSLRYLMLGSTNVTDAGLQYLKGLHLRLLDLGKTQITDRGLASLKDQTGPAILLLNGTKVTDAGLKQLEKKTKLETLLLSGTSITDAGLTSLTGMTRLRTLRLMDTAVTDAGLEPLKGLKSLKVLDLKNTKISLDGLNQLKQALPECTIEYP